MIDNVINPTTAIMTTSLRRYFIFSEAESRVISVGCTQRNLPEVMSVLNKYSGKFIEVKQLSKVLTFRNSKLSQVLSQW